MKRELKGRINCSGSGILASGNSSIPYEEGTESVAVSIFFTA